MKFEGANWLRILAEGNISVINLNQMVNEMNNGICKIVVEAANVIIPRSKGNEKKKIVPWWTN